MKVAWVWLALIGAILAWQMWPRSKTNESTTPLNPQQTAPVQEPCIGYATAGPNYIELRLQDSERTLRIEWPSNTPGSAAELLLTLDGCQPLTLYQP